MQKRKKKENDLAERTKFGAKTTSMYCLLLHKNDFQIMIFWLIWPFYVMSDYDDFENDQIS